MKKKQILLILVAIVIFVVAAALILRQLLIIDSWVCSDVCFPKDLQKIYKGIENKYLCILIGGKPLTYYGWGEFHSCLVK